MRARARPAPRATRTRASRAGAGARAGPRPRKPRRGRPPRARRVRRRLRHPRRENQTFDQTKSAARPPLSAVALDGDERDARREDGDARRTQRLERAPRDLRGASGVGHVACAPAEEPPHPRETVCAVRTVRRPAAGTRRLGVSVAARRRQQAPDDDVPRPGVRGDVQQDAQQRPEVLVESGETPSRRSSAKSAARLTAASAAPRGAERSAAVSPNGPGRRSRSEKLHATAPDRRARTTGAARERGRGGRRVRLAPSPSPRGPRVPGRPHPPRRSARTTPMSNPRARARAYPLNPRRAPPAEARGSAAASPRPPP